MAVKQLQIAKVKPRKGNTTAATKKNSSNRKPPKSPGKGVGRKRNPTSSQAAANQPDLKPGEGGSKLLRAINSRAVVDCDAIAEAIVNKAKGGDISGLRLLADLTGAKAQSSQLPKKPTRQPLPYSADQLSAQAIWPPPSNPEVDTGFAGRENEN